MIKVLVADCHPIIRTGLKALFEPIEDIQMVGSLESGRELFDFLDNNKVDVVLTEIDLPELNGITALRTFKREYSDIKVIIFSSQPEEVYAISTIKSGAAGFLSKKESTDAIKNAIIKVYNGGVYISNELAQQLALGNYSGRNSSALFKRLSTRELEVLKLLSAGRRNKEVAEELDINEKTVSTYKARLMRKLGVGNIVDLINKAKLLELEEL